MSGNEEHDDAGDSDKPRRLDKDTAQYLLQIEKQFEMQSASTDPMEIDILVGNVLEEIKLRTACAACDRYTNAIIEKLCYSANFSQLLEIIHRCSPYTLFLAKNRHSSHVLQAAMSRLCHLIKYEGLQNIEGEILSKSVLDFVKPLLNDIYILMNDINGSHVLRSAICALVGMPVVIERKGKGSKHQHSIALAEPLDKLICPTKFYLNNEVCFSVPEDFHESLGAAVASLLSISSVDLQNLIASPSSCAVLGLLLRVFYSPLIIQGGPELAERIVLLALSWENREDGPIVFYAMAGDRSGSYFLQTVVECCSETSFLDLVTKAVLGSALEYSKDSSANFVLQSILKRFSSEFTQYSSNTCNIKKTTKNESDEITNAASASVASMTSDIFNKMMQMVVALLKELSIGMSELAGQHTNARAGVVLWMIEAETALLAAALSRNKKTDKHNAASGQPKTEEEVSVAVVTALGIGEKLLRLWTTSSTSSEKGEAIDVAILAGALERMLTPSIKEKVNDKDKDKDKESTHMLVARILGALLRSSKAPNATPSQHRCGEAILTALSHFSGSMLLTLCKSGPMSRAILDYVFDENDFTVIGAAASTSTSTSSITTALSTNAAKKSQPSKPTAPVNLKAMAISKIIEALLPQLVDLATDFIGHHILRRAFLSCGLTDREKIVQVLVADQDRWQGSREGRSTKSSLLLELYVRDGKGWRSAMEKQIKAIGMLVELETTGSGGPAAKKGPGHSNSHNLANKSDNSGRYPTVKDTKPTAATTATVIAVSSHSTGGINDGGVEDTTTSKSGRKRKRKHDKSKNKVSENPLPLSLSPSK